MYIEKKLNIFLKLKHSLCVCLCVWYMYVYTGTALRVMTGWKDAKAEKYSFLIET